MAIAEGLSYDVISLSLFTVYLMLTIFLVVKCSFFCLVLLCDMRSA